MGSRSFRVLLYAVLFLGMGLIVVSQAARELEAATPIPVEAPLPPPTDVMPTIRA